MKKRYTDEQIVGFLNRSNPSFRPDLTLRGGQGMGTSQMIYMPFSRVRAADRSGFELE